MNHAGDFKIMGRDADGKAYGRWTEGCQRLYARMGNTCTAMLCTCDLEREATVHYAKGCGRKGRNSIRYQDVTCKTCRRMLKL